MTLIAKGAYDVLMEAACNALIRLDTCRLGPAYWVDRTDAYTRVVERHFREETE